MHPYDMPIPTVPRGSGSIAAGVAPLTARECQVAMLVARGFTNRRIGEALVIAERTAESHIANICNKLGYCSRSQVAVWAAQRGLLDADVRLAGRGAPRG